MQIYKRRVWQYGVFDIETVTLEFRCDISTFSSVLRLGYLLPEASGIEVG